MSPKIKPLMNSKEMYNNISSSICLKKFKDSVNNNTRGSPSIVWNENISPSQRQQHDYSLNLLSSPNNINKDLNSAKRKNLSWMSVNESISKDSKISISQSNNSSILNQWGGNKPNFSNINERINWTRGCYNTPKFNHNPSDESKDQNYEKEMQRLKKTLGDIKDQEWKFNRMLDKQSPNYKSQSWQDYSNDNIHNSKQTKISTRNNDLKRAGSQRTTNINNNLGFSSEITDYVNKSSINYKPAKRMFNNNKGKSSVISYYEKWSPQRFTVIDTPVLIEKSWK